MQVSKKWHSDRMERLGVDDLFDPYGNILVATDYISELFEESDDVYYVLMRYNMETERANELYKEGYITEYALGIVERAKELEAIEIQKQKELEEHCNAIFEAANLKTLPVGGVTMWIE